MSPRSRTSAGILMFRRRGDEIEFLLAHPGGPLFVHKDNGHWTIPKGEAAPGEDLLTRARIEFAEEVGLEPRAPISHSARSSKRVERLSMPGPWKVIYRRALSRAPTLSSWSGHHAPARCKVSRKLIAWNSLPKNSPARKSSPRKLHSSTVSSPRSISAVFPTRPPLEKLIGIHIDGDGDVFGEGEFVERFPNQAAQTHDRFAAQQDVEAIMTLQFFERRRRGGAAGEFLG